MALDFIKYGKKSEVRPIIFSAPMVCAILECRKTQTRRIVKPQPKLHKDVKMLRYGPGPLLWPITSNGFQCGAPIPKFPYGQPGARLWVRETWGPCEGGFCYRASESKNAKPDDGRWRPSIHMPRDASRITLEIKNVRIERLCEITNSDAEAEGVDMDNNHTPRFKFCCLWDSINGRGSYDKNPWVWVIEFRKI